MYSTVSIYRQFTGLELVHVRRLRARYARAPSLSGSSSTCTVSSLVVCAVVTSGSYDDTRLRVGVEYDELARGVAEAEHVLVEQLHVPLRLHLPRGRSMLSRRCYCRCRWRWWWRRGTGCGVGVTFSPLTNVPLVDPRSITYGRTILVGPSSVSFSVKRNWITACCGRGAARSARDRDEIAPRSRLRRARGVVERNVGDAPLSAEKVRRLPVDVERIELFLSLTQ